MRCRYLICQKYGFMHSNMSFNFFFSFNFYGCCFVLFQKFIWSDFKYLSNMPRNWVGCHEINEYENQRIDKLCRVQIGHIHMETLCLVLFFFSSFGCYFWRENSVTVCFVFFSFTYLCIKGIKIFFHIQFTTKKKIETN